MIDDKTQHSGEQSPLMNTRIGDPGATRSWVPC